MRRGGAGADCSAAPTAAANAPPPTCTNTRSKATHCADAAARISHPSVRPPSRHSAFSGPCTANGSAPAATASRKRYTHGSPGGSSGRRGQMFTSACSACSRASTASLAHGGTNTRIRHPSAAASVDAAMAALPHDEMASGGRSATDDHGASPICSAACRCSRMLNRCRAFWLPATLPVSSFTHTPPAAAKPSSSLNASARCIGVVRNPTPATAATRWSRSRTSTARAAASMPCAAANAAQANPASNATNGFGSSTTSTGAVAPTAIST